MKAYYAGDRQYREITEYGSDGTFLAPFLEIKSGAQLNWIVFDPGGTVGDHQAASPQLMIVLSGEGWARGEGVEPLDIEQGDVVFWDAGEWHESGSEQGMTVLVIESQVPDPTAFRSYHR